MKPVSVSVTELNGTKRKKKKNILSENRYINAKLNQLINCEKAGSVAGRESP